MATTRETPQLALGSAFTEELDGSPKTLGQIVTDGTIRSPGDSISTFLASLICELHGVDPTESEFQLYDHISPDDLDSLFEHAQRSETASWRFAIDFGTDTIIIRSDGVVQLKR